MVTKSRRQVKATVHRTACLRTQHRGSGWLVSMLSPGGGLELLERLSLATSNQDWTQMPTTRLSWSEQTGEMG